jgi:hypothetical protein
MNKRSTPGLIDSLFLRSLVFTLLTLAQIVLCAAAGMLYVAGICTFGIATSALQAGTFPCSVAVARMPRRIAGQI